MRIIRTLFLCSTVSALIALWLYRDSVLLSLGNFLIVTEANLQSADLIHVLGGSEDRVPYGVQLYSLGYGQQIFFSGRGPVKTNSATYVSNVHYAQVFAREQGLQLNGIVPFKSLASSTYEESIELKQVLESQDAIQSVIIVSEPFHMRRVRWIFDKKVGHRVSLQFAPVPFAMTQYKQRWWMDESSREFVIEEYWKNLFYRIRYQFESCT